MKLVMAISKDGYVARSPKDSMKWLGKTDKAVFRILTGVGGYVAVSRKTRALMPEFLEGRELYTVTRDPAPCYLDECTLEMLRRDSHVWLAGGQEVALAAIEADLVDEAHLCFSSRWAFPEPGQGIPERVTGALARAHKVELTTQLLDVRVECWHRIL